MDIELLRKKIEAYIPSQRDESLDWDEYYVKEESSGRVVRVRMVQIYPHGFDEMLYGVVTPKGRRIKGGFDDFGGFPKRYLYDNKEDCRAETHWMIDDWENLRKLQKEHGL